MNSSSTGALHSTDLSDIDGWLLLPCCVPVGVPTEPDLRPCLLYRWLQLDLFCNPTVQQCRTTHRRLDPALRDPREAETDVGRPAGPFS